MQHPVCMRVHRFGCGGGWQRRAAATRSSSSGGSSARCVAAAARPPGPEYAALEAAVGAINKVLALNSRARGGGSGGSGAGGGGDPHEAARREREAAAELARTDPGKLVTFRAKASGAKDVTVRGDTPPALERVFSATGAVLRGQGGYRRAHVAALARAVLARALASGIGEGLAGLRELLVPALTPWQPRPPRRCRRSSPRTPKQQRAPTPARQAPRAPRRGATCAPT